jgi:hypothetical protein
MSGERKRPRSSETFDGKFSCEVSWPPPRIGIGSLAAILFSHKPASSALREREDASRRREAGTPESEIAHDSDCSAPSRVASAQRHSEHAEGRATNGSKHPGFGHHHDRTLKGPQRGCVPGPGSSSNKHPQPQRGCGQSIRVAPHSVGHNLVEVVLVSSRLPGAPTWDWRPMSLWCLGDQRAANAKQALRDKLIEHKQQYIVDNGQDLPEIRNWKWRANKC